VPGAAQALSTSAAMVANRPAAEMGFSFMAIAFERLAEMDGVPVRWLSEFIGHAQSAPLLLSST